MFPLEIINMVIAQMGGYGAAETLPWLRPWDETFLCFSLLRIYLFFFGKHDKHSCSASAIINLSMVSIADSLLSTLHASANRILRCEANEYFIRSGYASSLVSRVLRLRRSTLARACTPLTKSRFPVVFGLTEFGSRKHCFHFQSSVLCRSWSIRWFPVGFM